MLFREVPTAHTPESLVEGLQGESGVQLLPRAGAGPADSWTLVVARPFLAFRSWGRDCEIVSGGANRGGEMARRFVGDPWRTLGGLCSRFGTGQPPELELPAGGCFGYWGYDLKRFLEPTLRCRPATRPVIPDCAVGFYSSVVAFENATGKAVIISTGLGTDGVARPSVAREEFEFWQRRLESIPVALPSPPEAAFGFDLESSLTRDEFVRRVETAQEYIRLGHIYQVNLAHRVRFRLDRPSWQLFRRLARVSPAPCAAFIDWGDVALASASPELFLKFDGDGAETRPIKGTRPRGADSLSDAILTEELRTSPKELAELVMITDLLRNDLGKVCDFGSVEVPELARLEKYSHVQHLMSVVKGRLRAGVTHLEALAACFPGGSITGAPKFRAMEIIEELEPVARGPYTGALGYLGFNRRSQLSIIIRTAVCSGGVGTWHSGAGIVADSIPQQEYEETLDKAAGLLAALGCGAPGSGPALKSTLLARAHDRVC